MLFAHHLPELGTDLVPALSTLNMQNLTHLDRQGKTSDGRKWPEGERERRRQKRERHTHRDERTEEMRLK
jgi:hypothetical protein